MTIWITRVKENHSIQTFSSKPYVAANGNWYVDCKTGSPTSPENARRILGDQWQDDGPFCFEVEIGEVARVRTREDVIAGLKSVLADTYSHARHCDPILRAIALIENPDSSNRE